MHHNIHASNTHIYPCTEQRQQRVQDVTLKVAEKQVPESLEKKKNRVEESVHRALEACKLESPEQNRKRN